MRICDVDVPVYGPSGAPLSELDPIFRTANPLLYRWEIYRNGSISTVYVGRASRGHDRPTITYPKVTSDLRASRNVRKLCADPVVPYLLRSPWGFRWIHHQLEAATYRIRHGCDPHQESAALFLFATDLQAADLGALEEEAISAARRQHGPVVTANGQHSMAHHDRADMDPAWTCIGNA